MNEKRFEITEYGSDYYIEIIDNEKELDENIYNPSQKLCLVECADLLNKLYEENGQLRKQIQNYEQLIANSYVGEEERLDGWVGQYVIWEDELQEYKNKKLVMNNDTY